MFRGPLPPNAAMKDQQSNGAYDSAVTVRQVRGAAWRGKFNIPSLNLDINIAAHVSKNASLEVLEVASAMPASIRMEMVPCCDAWPASFESSPPTENSVAFFFFPEGRDEVFDNLLNHTICNDFALKSMIGEAELLVFTSIQLPSNLHRFQGKPFLWGFFRGQQATASHQSDYHVHVRISQSNSGNHRCSKRKGSPITISSENSSLTQSSKGDRKGRRLDNAWEHAKPMDVLRQKAECRYCGFVSSHGGISRLKVHLGGGIPGIHLQGCNKVPPEVKKVMAEWFSEWLKNTKALWAKKVREESAGHVGQGHTKPLGVTCQRTDSNFSSESLPEGIPLQKTHLGGHPHMQAEARPKVLLSGWLKTLTPSTTNKSRDGARPETRGRRLDDAWKHATPLDEVRQKIGCNYCGFVSQYGGISRLKAHLGGGCPELHLQGCPQVPLEVKRVLEQWFNEWSKNSAASWMRKSHDSPNSSKSKSLLDETWKHAIPLDETRQVIRCKYCSFISRCGGIARLKAHLAGGDPITQLEGCPNVLPEIKNLMSLEKKKNRKKLKDASMESLGSVLQGSPGSSKRKSPLDDTWEHAIPLDETGAAIKCKYCSFVSRYGGIARLKAHLAGGDPLMQLEGCPNVSPDIKNIMAIGKNKNRKKSKDAMESLEGLVQGDGRTLMEAQRCGIRHHILQETLDEISNTSLKGRLQKLIDEKNTKLQTMQYEVQSLGMHLASTP